MGYFEISHIQKRLIVRIRCSVLQFFFFARKGKCVVLYCEHGVLGTYGDAPISHIWAWWFIFLYFEWGGNFSSNIFDSENRYSNQDCTKCNIEVLVFYVFYGTCLMSLMKYPRLKASSMVVTEISPTDRSSSSPAVNRTGRYASFNANLTLLM